jgi:SAM-dependent methyltransferase
MRPNEADAPNVAAEDFAADVDAVVDGSADRTSEVEAATGGSADPASVVARVAHAGPPPDTASGTTADGLAAERVRVLRAFCEGWGMAAPRILEFGAGTGTSLPALRRNFPDSAITLADVSGRSLAKARRLHGGSERHVAIRTNHVPEEDDSADIAFAAGVFHRVPAVEHDLWLRELRRIVRPGGRIVAFEPNPLSPRAQLAFARGQYGADAVLIGAQEMRERLARAGWAEPQAEFLALGTSAAATLRRAGPWLRRVPVGRDYAAHALRA